MAASNPRNTYALMQYYLREKLWRHAQIVAGDMFLALNDYTFLLWKAFAHDMEGAVADALREYKNCENKRGVHAAALVGIHLIYKRNRDTEAAAGVEQRLSDDERHMNNSAHVQAASLLWHAGEHSRARDMVAKVLDSEPEYRDEYTSVQAVRAWIDLSSGRGAFIDKCGQMFDRVINSEAVDGLTDIEAILGKVAVFEKKNQFFPAQELLNKCLVAHKSFHPAQIIKARQLLRVDDWDQAADLVTTVLSRDPSCIEALVLSTLNLMVKETRMTAASRNIADLIKAMQTKEPRNGHLYLTCAQCFSRLAMGNVPILTLTTSLAESAAQLLPQSTDVASEVAYQAMLRGDARTAATLYKKASTAGDGNMVPLLGMIWCAIHLNQLEDASKQLEFLTELQAPGQKNAELLFLTAQLRWRKSRDQQGSIEKLDQAVEAHKQEHAQMQSGMELFIKLNPVMMLAMAREYSQHCRTEPAENAKPDPLTEKARRLLDQLLRHVPGSTEAQLLSSRMAFVAGDIERASAMVAACIRQDQGLADAHILQARIHQFTHNPAAAMQSLEQALALDFEVNDTPQFNLLKGTLLYQKGELDPALQALQNGIKLSGGRDGKQPVPNSPTGKPPKPLSVQDHVSLFLQLAQVHLRMKDPATAQDVIRDATILFRDTVHAGRVTIANALLVSRTDVDKAFTLLRSVPQQSAHFLAAKAQMAQLYLTRRGNRRAFARCYEEVVEAMPSLQSFMHLGDAYASIEEPDKAITAYDKARALDPNNAELSIKIGRTLATTHDYQRALRYYRDAVAAEGNRTSLRTDLAQLYWRLGDTEKAVQTLKEAPVMRRPPAQDDMALALERVTLTTMQAQIYRASNDMNSAIECLIQARVYQSGVVQKARGESPDVIANQKRQAANICLELGDHHNTTHNYEKAVHYYSEGLKHDEANTRAMMSLAKLFLHRGDLDQCELQCNALLRVNPACEEAIVMLAEIMFRRGRYEDAAFHFLQLLDKQPDNAEAMVHYVHLLRRSGHLQEAPRSFEYAEKMMKPGQKESPGVSYAKGMYYKFIGNSREALLHLNQARAPRGNDWSQKALKAMVEVYVNPDGTNLWEDVEMRSEVQDNLNTAEKLLLDIEDSESRQMLQGYVLLASKRKENIERAITIFTEINEQRQLAAAEGDPETEKPSAEQLAERLHAPATVGMAIGHQLLKQSSRARTFLKRLTKPNTGGDEEDDYERGYLLLASIYIENGKFDVAQDLLKKAIATNKSCCRAWELMGLIFEKEQSYRDASDCYEQAWQLMQQKDPGVGFKLAFNYLKAKRFVQAIDVCHVVLGSHPNYPKIRKDVLERARMSLKP